MRQPLKILLSGKWENYELIDTGDFQKLERFGDVVTIRPEPQAVWSPALPQKEWHRRSDLRFEQEGSSSGTWKKKKSGLPDQWQIPFRSGGLDLKFKLALTAFKHVGIFPEQSSNWEFIFRNCRKLEHPKVLNLFAYTGAASLAARAGGADVIHCDSVKQVVNWASANMSLSGLDGIRWLVEDAFSFVKKETRRGRRFQGIILDPPAWGHGPRGEKWKLEEQINSLVKEIASLLDPEKGFLVFNAYSLGYSALLLGNLVRTHFGPAVSDLTELAELALEDNAGRLLPAGVVARLSLNRK